MLDREHSKLCFLPYSRSSVKLLSLEMRMEQDNSLMFLKHFRFFIPAFCTYTSCQEIPILGKHIPELATFLLQCGGNRDFDQEMRILALNALNWAVQ